MLSARGNFKKNFYSVSLKEIVKNTSWFSSCSDNHSIFSSQTERVLVELADKTPKKFFNIVLGIFFILENRCLKASPPFFNQPNKFAPDIFNKVEIGLYFFTSFRRIFLNLVLLDRWRDFNGR